MAWPEKLRYSDRLNERPFIVKLRRCLPQDARFAAVASRVGADHVTAAAYIFLFQPQTKEIEHEHFILRTERQWQGNPGRHC